MPFYEYECSSCKFYKEVMQKVSDAPLKKCPSCGRNTLKKLISAPVFRLKGGGWYETDFKSEQENKRNLAVADEKEASKKEEPKIEAKAENTAGTKTADKPEDTSRRKKPVASKKPVRKPAAKKSARKSAA